MSKSIDETSVTALFSVLHSHTFALAYALARECRARGGNPRQLLADYEEKLFLLPLVEEVEGARDALLQAARDGFDLAARK